MAHESTAGIPAGSSSGGSAKTYNIDPTEIEGYITSLETIQTNLNSAKTALEEDFPNSYESFMQPTVKEMYQTAEMGEFIDQLNEGITSYKDWLSEALAAKIAGDEERANKWANMQGGGDTPSDDASGATGSSGATPSSSSVPQTKTVKSDVPTGTTTQTTSPKVTVPSSSTGNGNNNDGGSTTTYNPGSSTTGSGSTGGSGTGTSSSGNSKSGTTLNPFGNGSNYGTSGHSVGGSLANSANSGRGNGSGAGSGDSGINAAGLAAGLANGASKTGKGLLDNYSELTSGASLSSMFGKGVGSVNSFKLGNGNGGILSGNAGTIAKAGLVLGMAGAGAAVVTAAHKKYYIFDPEDWESLVPSDRDSILKTFDKVQLSDGQVQLFETSTFKTESDILDEPAKKLEKAFKNTPEVQEVLNQKYGYDIFNDKGRVDRYLLFILMIIDGQSTISDYNLYTLVTDYIEDVDMSYSGLQMEDYIYNFEEELPQESAEATE